MILAISYGKIVMFFGELAQLARASRLHREGRGFESHILHHLEFKRTIWFVFLSYRKVDFKMHAGMIMNMKINRAYKFRIYPTKEQIDTFIHRVSSININKYIIKIKKNKKNMKP